MIEVVQLGFKRSTTDCWLINIILFNVLGILQANIFFYNRIAWEKGNNSYLLLNGSDTWLTQPW